MSNVNSPLAWRSISPDLQAHPNRCWQVFQTACQADFSDLNLPPAVLESLPHVWASSPWVATLCSQHPEYLYDLIQSGDLERPYQAADWQAIARHLPQFDAQTAVDEDGLMQAVRHCRQREMLRIAWRELANWDDLNTHLCDLSQLADTLIQVCTDYLYAALCQRFGTPYNTAAEQQYLVVLGMGKLGGQELNFSSDIDLIFLYPDAGQTQGAKRSLQNQDFFVRLGQKLVQSLGNITATGFAFRVDMRLRPFGDSGALAMNFDALETYYQIHAREWERYALLKARPITGNNAAKTALLNLLRPFIYRRYLDFSALAALRELKTQIDAEMRRKGFLHNIKLGQGGIREIEFICQSLQLIRGGRQPALQQRNLLSVLPRLEHYAGLPADVINELKQAYCFLRQLEHHLQMQADKQTQILPDDAISQARIAYSLGFADWKALLLTLSQHQTQVHQHFRDILQFQTPNDEIFATPSIWSNIWQAIKINDADYDLAHLIHEFKTHGIQASEAEGMVKALLELQNSPALRWHSRHIETHLDKLMPLFLAYLQQHANNASTAQRVCRLIEAVAGRSVYLALLLEYPQALEQLIVLCERSCWVAAQITRYPILLDELLDARHLYQILDQTTVEHDLRALLAHVPDDDLEMQMDSLRHFKRAHVLRVAAQELASDLPVQTASRYLSTIADNIVKFALTMVKQQLEKKHGLARFKVENEWVNAGFCVIAYGKAGSQEMNYHSDLDLVFLHDSGKQQAYTSGNKSIDNTVFFARLVTRLMSMLSTTTAAGDLYEIDPRLRPNGKSGLLVSNLHAFQHYQQKEAWIWEHQALIRARVIAGDSAMTQQFIAIRHEILCQPRDLVTLTTEVTQMRQKMRDNLDKSTASQFDIKQGVGGLTDIEFMQQYMVLRWANQYPQLIDTIGLVACLECCQTLGLWSENRCTQLTTAYLAYRAHIHKNALQHHNACVSDGALQQHRQHVSHIWQQVFSSQDTDYAH